ncbi:MAG TPA: metallophosphoesterase family protein [Thiobacillaceae bacterium]|nr:metallophosphoesterase family protein [Thiobacillaceae bacterium]HNU65129.1 metallophosphoesterase family protein [Thiobacillaceae bacterium]
MRLGLLGDIHGNAAALEAALAGVRRHAADHLVLTGDYVGYYYSPAQVLALLEPWPRTMVRGNHEDMLARIMQEPSSAGAYTRKYGHGLEVALRELSPVQLKDLTSLPERILLEMDGLRILVAHGSPWEPDAYLYPDAPPSSLERFAEIDADIVVLGHTHYPMNRLVHGRTILNPGSVGQPRDRRPGAAWALFDTRDRRCAFFREPYDMAPVGDAAYQMDPGLPYLREVLLRS